MFNNNRLAACTDVTKLGVESFLCLFCRYKFGRVYYANKACGCYENSAVSSIHIITT